MKVDKIGEFGLIERIRKNIRLDASVFAGSGDDCAVLKYSRDNYMLATCDMLIEGVDFTRRDDPYLIGRKALAMSLSDIAACSGVPRYALVSLGLPKNLSLKTVDGLAGGMIELAKRFKVNIVGGDLSRSQKLILDVSVVGTVEKRRLTLRSGAKCGDIIFVSGALGGSIKGKHLKFSPRIKEARQLTEDFRISAMIDISDGLIQDLFHILKASGKGAVIYEEMIPVSNDARGLSDALFSGEDFELLFTAAPRQAGRILKMKGFRAIGEITDIPGLRLVDRNRRFKMLRPRGFRHF